MLWQDIFDQKQAVNENTSVEYDPKYGVAASSWGAEYQRAKATSAPPVKQPLPQPKVTFNKASDVNYNVPTRMPSVQPAIAKISTSTPYTQSSAKPLHIDQKPNDADIDLGKIISMPSTTKTSTGGTVTTTPVGRIHKAAVDNPNIIKPTSQIIAKKPQAKKQPVSVGKRPPKWKGRQPKGGFSPATTKDEQERLLRRIAQAEKNKSVSELLEWSNDFDPSISLLRKIRLS